MSRNVSTPRATAGPPDTIQSFAAVCAGAEADHRDRRHRDDARGARRVRAEDPAQMSAPGLERGDFARCRVRLHHGGSPYALATRRKIARPSRACTSPSLAVYIAGQRAERAPARSTFLRKWEEIIHETRLYPANDDLQSQSGRRTQRSAHVGRGPSAVRARQEVHPRDRRPDVGRVRAARRRTRRIAGALRRNSSRCCRRPRTRPRK